MECDFALRTNPLVHCTPNSRVARESLRLRNRRLTIPSARKPSPGYACKLTKILSRHTFYKPLKRFDNVNVIERETLSYCCSLAKILTWSYRQK